MTEKKGKAHTTEHKTKKASHKKAKPKKNSSNTLITIAALIIIVGLVMLILNMDKLFTSPTPKEDVAAFVNDNTITMAQLDKQYNSLPEQYQQFITKEDFLGQMISETLLLQSAKEQNIDIPQEEVDAFYDKSIAASGLTEAEIEDKLVEQGLTTQDLKDTYKKQLLITKLLNETVFSDIGVTDDEIKAYYDANPAEYVAPEGQIRVSHILVNTSEKADEIIQMLDDGADFAELAREYSIGPSNVKGGDLGFFGKGVMVPEFEDAAFALDVGEVSKPVHTKFGWHVIMRTPDTVDFESVKEDIKTTLLGQKQQTAFDDYLTGLRTAADVTILYEPPAQPGKYTECVAKYNVSPDTVVFYHANWCPHCKKMMPIVKKLEGEGLKFLWAETSTGENVDVVKECLSDVVQGGVPEFVCANSGEYKLGEVSEDELRTFAQNCANIIV